MIPVDEIRAYVQANDEEGVEEEFLLRLEASAIDALGRACNRYFGEPAEATVVVSGSGSRIYLPDPPTGEVFVEYRGGVGDTTWSAYTGTFEVHGRSVFVDGTTGWPYGSRNLRLTYERGYDEDTAPAALKQAVLQLIRFFYADGRVPADGLSTDPNQWPVPGLWALMRPFYRSPLAGPV